MVEYLIDLKTLGKVSMAEIEETINYLASMYDLVTPVVSEEYSFSISENGHMLIRNSNNGYIMINILSDRNIIDKVIDELVNVIPIVDINLTEVPRGEE